MNKDRYVLTKCPECGTEHRVHKIKVMRFPIKCTSCGARFLTLEANDESNTHSE
ncbi:MAG: hypothetical protein DRI69_09820 [Bacteroidetes bacterium]|nr:MAG: hypothetical protein DRI69_09820 [Bacteroidota bacterium]